MKVLILSSKLPYPARDGGAIATLNLALGLVENGFEVDMLSFNTKKHYLPIDQLPASITEKINIYTIDIDTEIKVLKAFLNLLFSTRPYIAERFYHHSYSLMLSRLIRKNNYHIVQLEGPYFAPYLPLIRKQTQALVSLRAHNIEHEIWNSRWKNETNPLRRLYLKILASRIQKLEKQLLFNLDLVIPISERDAGILSSINPSLPSCMVPTGIDMSKYIPSPDTLNQDIFFIGALDWTPNQEGLLWFVKEVLPFLSEEMESLQIHIAGRNAPEKFKKLLAHPQIVFHGEVENSQEFMNRHGVMAVPLLSGSGIRIKILEAMALGKCIVTTTTGIEGIPATHLRHLLIGDDGRTFAMQLKMLLSDAKLAESLSMESRKLIREKFDNFAIANKICGVYKEML